MYVYSIPVLLMSYNKKHDDVIQNDLVMLYRMICPVLCLRRKCNWGNVTNSSFTSSAPFSSQVLDPLNPCFAVFIERKRNRSRSLILIIFSEVQLVIFSVCFCSYRQR